MNEGTENRAWEYRETYEGKQVNRHEHISVIFDIKIHALKDIN